MCAYFNAIFVWKGTSLCTQTFLISYLISVADKVTTCCSVRFKHAYVRAKAARDDYIPIILTEVAAL